MHLPTKSGIIMLCNGSNGDRVWYPIYQKWVKSVIESDGFSTVD